MPWWVFFYALVGVVLNLAAVAYNLRSADSFSHHATIRFLRSPWWWQTVCLLLLWVALWPVNVLLGVGAAVGIRLNLIDEDRVRRLLL
jgi:hypothetical protein